MSRPTSSELARIARFGLVGLLNTAVGFCVILGCLKSGLGDYLSNAIGYTVGLAISFAGNSRWTFQARPTRTAALRFMIVFALAYAANLAVLAAARHLGYAEQPLAQLAAIAAYTVLSYAGFRLWAFAPAEQRVS